MNEFQLAHRLHELETTFSNWRSKSKTGVCCASSARSLYVKMENLMVDVTCNQSNNQGMNMWY